MLAVNALIGIAIGIVTDAIMCGAFGSCKSGGEFVASIVFNGIFGALGGALGTGAAKLASVGLKSAAELQLKLGGSLLRFFVSKGLVHLFIAGAKATAATVNTILQTAVENRLRPPSRARPSFPPSLTMLAALFTVNLFAEAFFLHASQAEIVAEGAQKAFAKTDKAEIVEEMLAQRGEHGFGSYVYSNLNKLHPTQQAEITNFLLSKMSAKFGLAGLKFSGDTPFAKFLEVLESFMIATYGALVQYRDGQPWTPGKGYD